MPEGIPHVYFEEPSETKIPAVPEGEDDSDDDDDEERETDPAVVAMLGFDPAEDD